MKLTREYIKDLIHDVIEEAVNASIIDESEYNKHVKYLKDYLDTDENRKSFTDKHIPFQSFKDMKGFNKYIVPTASLKTVNATVGDLVAKQADGIDETDLEDFFVGDKVYITVKGFDIAHIIVAKDGDNVTLRKIIPASQAIKNKANAIAKYEEYQQEQDDINNAPVDSEQQSLF